MKIKKWITFDLDETLIENPFEKWVFPEIETTIQSYVGEKIQVTQDLTEEHKRRLDNQEFVAAYDWDDILNSYLTEKDIKIDIDIEEIVQNHSYYPKIYLLEENVLESLRQLKNKGYYLAAVTNGYYKYQFPVIKALELDELFDDIITPSEEGYAKPDIKMVERLNKEGKIVAHVGDRLDHDVSFSNNLNVYSVLFNSKMEDNIKELTVTSRMDYLKNIDIMNELYSISDETHSPKFVIHSIAELNEILK